MRQSLTTSERLLSGRLSRFLGFECGISPVRSQRRMMARFDPLGRYSDGEVDDTDEGKIMLIALVGQVIPEKAVTRQTGNDAGHY
jgi:hypothetical protein